MQGLPICICRRVQACIPHPDQDHVNAYETRNYTKSAFARHLLQEDHTGDEEKILHIERNNPKRLVLENIEIVEHQLHHGYNVLNRISRSARQESIQILSTLCRNRALIFSVFNLV